MKAGREVVLTERGRPIAVIKPLHAIGSPDTAIERLAGEGRLRLAPVPGPATRLETDPRERAAAVADTPRGPGCPLTGRMDFHVLARAEALAGAGPAAPARLPLAPLVPKATGILGRKLVSC